MSSVTPVVVDTLLALRRPVDVPSLSAVTQTEEAVNDVRAPSRAAVERQLGTQQTGARGAAPEQPAPRFGETLTLSAAARAIGALLGADPDARSGASVRGASPVWPSASVPLPAPLAGALARAVATSGLFYESHLQQFVAGTRPLALLAQEPQARLGTLASTQPELLKPALGDASRWLSPAGKGLAGVPASLGNAATPSASGAAALSASLAAVAGALPDTLAAALPVTGPQAQRSGQADPPAIAEGPRPGIPGRVDAAYAAANGAVAALVQRLASSTTDPAGPDEASGLAKTAPTPAAAAASPRGGEQAVATIHPEALSLVRQQLDFLAVPFFRWQGEVWPGTSMEWDIHEDAPEQNEAGDADTAPPVWHTRLAMCLPQLQDVEVRLSLAGSTLQVHLAARAGAALGLLGEGRQALLQRLAGAGLQLTDLQVGALPVTPPAQEGHAHVDAG